LRIQKYLADIDFVNSRFLRYFFLDVFKIIKPVKPEYDIMLAALMNVTSVTIPQEIGARSKTAAAMRLLPVLLIVAEGKKIAFRSKTRAIYH
jgi:hypothetical protein